MNRAAQRPSLSDTVYAVDLAKNVFEVHTFGPHGVCWKVDRLSRKKFVAKFTNPHTERGVVVMEACASSHHWRRQLGDYGYRRSWYHHSSWPNAVSVTRMMATMPIPFTRCTGIPGFGRFR